MVDRYTDDIIRMFVAEYTPRQICEELRLCKPEVHQPLFQLDSNVIPPLEPEEEETAVELAGGQNHQVRTIGGNLIFSFLLYSIQYTLHLI